jgi:uncharacterized protein (DUF1697 family)
MNIHIALLRAVNVGGSGRSLPMADLRDMLVHLGCGNPRTLLQSGNAVFALKTKSAQALETKLEAATLRRFGIEVAYLLRSVDEWDAIIARNPFVRAAKDDPGCLVMMALKSAPSAAAVQALRAEYKGPETFEVIGRNAYIVYPEGQGRSKFSHALIERRFGVAGTARNWNTVLKLAVLAQESPRP